MSDQTPKPEPLKTQIVSSPLADDLLRGVPAISGFIGEEDEHKVYYALERRLIPAGKQGANWIASKRALTAHYERLTNPSLPAAAEHEPVQVARRGRRRRIV